MNCSHMPLACLALLLAVGAQAQVSPGTPSKIAPNDPGVVSLAEQPLELASIGLRVFPPAGAKAEANSVGSQTAGQIISPDGTWIIKIAGPRTSKAQTTLEDAAIAALNQLLEAAGVANENGTFIGTAGRLLSREPAEGQKLLIRNGDKEREFHRFYVSIPPLKGKDASVRGFAITRVSPSQFLTFELYTTESNYQRTRAIFETVIAAAEIQDPTSANADRAAAIKAGMMVLEGVTTEELNEIISTNAERWERLYRPAASGLDTDATEIGYRRIIAKRGTRADLPRSSGSSGNTPGIIVQLDVRALDSVKAADGKVLSGRVIDSKSYFFASDDGEEEAWTVANRVAEGGQVSSFSEIGARNGKSMSVRIEGAGAQTIKPEMPAEGYVSRAKAFLLPQIIAHEGVFTEVGFYTYQSDAGTIVLRRDTLAAPESQPDLIQLTTRLSDDKRPQRSVFSDKGKWIRTELPDGSVWEPVTFQKLMSLWTNKGLPTK